jgi:hypothetical protein
MSQMHFGEVTRSRVKGLEVVMPSVLGKAGQGESLYNVINFVTESHSHDCGFGTSN